MPKTLIISVGGSIQPIISSINHHVPENIIFFTSTETEAQVSEIVHQINFKRSKFDTIVTTSAECINDCLRSLLKDLPAILTRWKASPDEVIVDYTGGTKSMSAALVLATIEKTKCFSYVGGKTRNKEGIGTVINGQENILILGNPWDELAIEEKKSISLYFNSGRYLEAIEIAVKALNKVSPREKSFFELIKQLINAYYKWDSFFYSNAKHELNKAEGQLRLCVSQISNETKLVSLLENIRENQRFLNILLGKEEEFATVPPTEVERKIKREEYVLLDLLANAKRRAEIENRYDDAIVRIYRAIEKRGQMELTKYGLDASCINLDKIPESIKGEIKEKYFDEGKKIIKVPLYGCYKILKALEEEKNIPSIGHRFFEFYDLNIRQVIDFRNNSIIVHGSNPLDREKYERAWRNCLEFLEISEDSLPKFPELKL